jgi:hypothetical protein
MDWFRWHHGTVSDPKWRVIARRAGQPVIAVVSVFACMLERASQSDERGTIAGWDDEDIAAGLDMDTEDVAAIRDAMQGKVLDGVRLTGWEKRQPKREDGSSERAKSWREAKRTDANATERTRTQKNAEEIREEKKELSDASASDRAREAKPAPVIVPMSASDPRGSRLSRNWQLPDDWREWAEHLGMPPPIIANEADKFRDYWCAKPGAGGRKSDWQGTWRNWCRRVMEAKHGQRTQHDRRGAGGILAAVADLEAADRRHADFGDGV